MAYVYKDRVKEPSTTTGTGAVTGSGTATPKFLPLSTIGNSNTFAYTIEHDTLTEWEVGIGTYTTASNSFTRDLVLASSNAGALVTFSAGSKTVFNTLPAARIHPPLANTQVGVGDSNSVLAGSTALTFDPAFGPTAGLVQTAAFDGAVLARVVNTSAGAAAHAAMRVDNGTSNFAIHKYGTAHTASGGLLTANTALLNNLVSGNMVFLNGTGTNFIWTIGGYSAANEALRLGASRLSFTDTSGNTAAQTDIAINNSLYLTKAGSTYVTNGVIAATDAYTYNSAGKQIWINVAGAGFVWTIGGYGTANEKMRLSTAAQLTVTDTSTTGYPGVRVSNDNATFNIYKFGSAWVANGLQAPNQAYLENASGQTINVNTTVNDFIWAMGGFGAANEKMRLNSNSLAVNIPNAGGTLISATNTDTGASSYTRLGLEVSGSALYIHKLGANYSGAPAQAWFYNSAGTMLHTNVAAADFVWQRAGVEVMRIGASTLTVEGQPMLRWRGAWNVPASTFYNIGDVTYYGAGTYVCIIAHAAVPPTNASYWLLISERPAYGNLPIAATTTWDVAALSSVWSSVNQSFTMANPTNQVAGRTYTWLAVMGGAFTITWGTAWQFPYGRKPTTSASGCDAYSFFSDGGTMRGVMQPQFA